MTWSRVPSLPARGRDGIAHPAKSAYLSSDGAFRVTPVFARDRRGYRTKRTAWALLEGNRQVGMSFHTAQLAKAFAEALSSLGDDKSARGEFIRGGGTWCARWEREKRLTGSKEPVPFIYMSYASVDNGRRTSLTFKWWGGEYIDISPSWGGPAFEVINVWDSERDRSTIAKNQSAFERHVKKWLTDPDRDFESYEEMIR